MFLPEGKFKCYNAGHYNPIYSNSNMAFSHTGILLTNIGSPDQPTPESVRQFLAKFLSDRRVVSLPRILWLPILYGIILRTRPARSAELYRKIWTENGSPLLVYSKKIAEKLQARLQIPVALGMHYSNPSIPHALEQLRKQRVKKIIVLPLYPQYSATTTASTFDQVNAVLKKWDNAPEIATISNYADDEDYISAITHSIQKHSFKHLLFSFHGIPQRNIDKGDPYADQCGSTVRLLTEKLQLPKDKYSFSFQSRLGYAKWLMPYTDQVLQELPKQGVTDLHVVCPGFAVDCLETLEEIAIRGKEQFLEAGGSSLQYIPALNDSDEHLEMLERMIRKMGLSND